MTDAIVWAGAEALRSSLRPIADLHPHPRNPRRGDVAEISRSLKRFGQVRAVLADAGDTIIAGNHTYLAARELGWTHVAVVANDFGSPEDARDYLLADNRLGDLGEYERAELLAMLDELEETGRWDGTGYQPDDLADLRDLDRLASAPPPARDPLGDPPPAPPMLREVVLLFTEAQLEGVSGNLRILRARYGLEGVTEAVLEAVKREALRLNQGVTL